MILSTITSDQPPFLEAAHSLLNKPMLLQRTSYGLRMFANKTTSCHNYPFMRYLNSTVTTLPDFISFPYQRMSFMHIGA